MNASRVPKLIFSQMWAFSALWQIPAHVFGGFLMSVVPVQVAPYEWFLALISSWNLIVFFQPLQKETCWKILAGTFYVGLYKSKIILKIMHAVAFRKAAEIFIEELDIGAVKHLTGLGIDFISFWIDNIQKKIVKTNISVSLDEFLNLFFVTIVSSI